MVFAGVVPDLDIGFLKHVTGLITITQQVHTHAKYGAMGFLIKTSKSLTVALSDSSQRAYQSVVCFRHDEAPPVLP
jgi:hypothetical protein